MKTSCYLMPQGGTLRDAMECMEHNGAGIVVIVDENNRLVGVLTDGDVRRCFLRGTEMNTPLESVLADKEPGSFSKPLTMPVGSEDHEILNLMKKKHIRQVPVVHDDGRVQRVALLEDLLDIEEIEQFDQFNAILPAQALVMAGGFGTRLRPLTESIPKPMLKVGGRPILGWIISQLRDNGIRDVLISTFYKKEVIINHFGSGKSHGINIQYLEETEPLGTAGILGRIKHPDRPTFVINGDILSRINFKAMFEFHKEHNALATMGVTPYDVMIPYGVVELDGLLVSQIIEKPVRRNYINAGIYLFEPEVFHYAPPTGSYLMTDLLNTLIQDHRDRVVSFPIHEYWRDIGEHNSYTLADEEASKWEVMR